MKLSLRANRLMIALPLAFIPVILVLLLLTFDLHVNLTDGIPTWSDEIVYWQEINAFRSTSFQGGYFTFEEIPAGATFTHFGPHGPIFTGIAGLIARFTGWGYATLPIYNFVLITFALGIFLILVPFNRTQYLIFALLISTFWGILLFLPATMQETTHFSIAIFAALIFYQRLARSQPLPRYLKILFTLFFVTAGLIKVSWAFLLLPFLLMDPAHRTRRDYLISGGIALGIIGTLFLLFSAWSAPYPLNFSQAFLNVFARTPLEGLQLLEKNLALNVQRLRLGNPLEVIQRYLIILLLLTLTCAYIIRIRIRNKSSQFMRRLHPWLNLSDVEFIFHMVNLGLLILVQFVLYDVFDWRDYRVFAPHLLLSLLILIMFNRIRLVGIIIAINLLTTPLFISTFHDFSGNVNGLFGVESKSRYQLTGQIKKFEQTTANDIIYDENAQNDWCNTLLTDNFYPELLTLPAGIGISVTLDSNSFNRTPKSRYLLFSDQAFAPLKDQVKVQHLVSTSVGELYLNVDADCD